MIPDQCRASDAADSKWMLGFNARESSLVWRVACAVSTRPRFEIEIRIKSKRLDGMLWLVGEKVKRSKFPDAVCLPPSVAAVATIPHHPSFLALVWREDRVGRGCDLKIYGPMASAELVITWTGMKIMKMGPENVSSFHELS